MQNDEEAEQSADIYWQMACADLRLLERGVPIADLVEEDDGRRDS
jgi:hypothetical protein